MLANALCPLLFNEEISSLQCRRILGGRKLLVNVRTVLTAIFVMTEED